MPENKKKHAATNDTNKKNGGNPTQDASNKSGTNANNSEDCR